MHPNAPPMHPQCTPNAPPLHPPLPPQVLAGFLRIVLEVINTVLAVGLQRNPELVYAVLHRQDVLLALKGEPKLRELVDNIQVGGYGGGGACVGVVGGEGCIGCCIQVGLKAVGSEQYVVAAFERLFVWWGLMSGA